MPTSLKIGFLASEATPFAKTGGLADVAAALPAMLRARGQDARLIIPFHAAIDRSDLDLAPVEAAQDFRIEAGPHSHGFSVWTTRNPAGDLPVYLVDCPALFHRDSIYTTGPDEAWRFAFFARAAIECFQRLGWAPNVIHCNDWHTALVPLLLRTVYEWDQMFADSKTLLTIHNLGYQGAFAAGVLEQIGLDPWTHLFDQEDLQAGRVGFLKTGLIYADAISTVSPTYAREIQTEEYGMGLERLLRARASRLVGILNGVDYAEWSPTTDRHIPHLFSAGDTSGKLKNKRHLLEQLGLEPGDDVPLLGIISRLAHQKGFDLLFDVLPALLAKHPMRLVVLGSGERRYEDYFAGLQRRFAGKVCYHRGYHDELAHVIEAASDMFLMPSRYEPCGLNQMFGMRYGTLPIVRRTGGLADSVEPVDPKRGSGTGFVFDHFNPEALRWAMEMALHCFEDRDLWRQLVKNAMAENFSWEIQVEPYLELYRSMADR